jgi:uncharacterized protein
MRFAGYAAIFDRPDRGGDIIRRGAFAGARAEATPVLLQHDAARTIGRVETLEEDANGLRIIAEVADDSEAAAALASGALTGLSFGYRVRQARRGAYRELTKVELIEVSLVTHPMQPLARVLAVEG